MLTKILLILVTVITTIAIIHGVNVYSNNVFSQPVQQPTQPQPQQNQAMPSNFNAEASGGVSSNGSNSQVSEKNKAEQAQVPPSQQVSEQKKYNAQVTKVLNHMNAPINKTLPSSTTTSLGTEPNNENNWITANHDIFGTRHSNQTIIGKDNVANLQVKWIFNDPSGIESPPLVIGDRVYVQDNKATVFAFDTKSGLNQWKTNAGNGSGAMHGLTFDQGIIFASSGSDAKVVAVNATDGTILWKSPQLGPSSIGYSIIAAPIVWKDYVVVGSAGGDSPPNTGAVQGNITAVSRTDGHILWSFKTTFGSWVGPGKSPPNGGATAWSGGAFDPLTGLLYIPVGNATPDFNATTRQGEQLYANHMLAINITNGKLVWATPFIAQGTVLKNVKIPDTMDRDTKWGSTLSNVKFDNGTQKKVVVGSDKRGDVIAMDAATGKPIWWTVLGTIYGTNVDPQRNGSGLVFPGATEGAQGYHAVYNNDNTLYFAITSNGYNFFINGKDTFIEPVINSTKSGIGNGTITSLDLQTGKIKWQTPINLPTRVSPLVTNGIVISGYKTTLGKLYTANTFGTPQEGPIAPTGMIMALDKDTGKILWTFNVGSEIGVGGPSIGNGMLFVPTGILGGPIGSLVAFGLP
jgi:alcohol dehydrogenase (cytochrome c)